MAQGRMMAVWGPRVATAPRHLTSQRARLARTDQVSYIKEPYIAQKEPYITQKEPYITQKEPYITRKVAQDNPM